MAGKERAKTKVRKRSRIKYFYLNGMLHKTLHVNKSEDIITTWNFSKRKRFSYTYSDVIKRMGRAFTTREVGQMIGRERLSILFRIQTGDVEKPEKTYSLGGDPNRGMFLWSEDDIMKLHDFYMTQHRGRPRNDGLITTQALPSKRELLAMIRSDFVLYVKDGDKFVPTWQAKEL